jgi:hypothetical protein
MSSVSLNSIVCATALPVSDFEPMIFVLVIGHAAWDLTPSFTRHCAPFISESDASASMHPQLRFAATTAVAVRRNTIPDFPCAIGENASFCRYDRVVCPFREPKT